MVSAGALAVYHDGGGAWLAQPLAAVGIFRTHLAGTGERAGADRRVGRFRRKRGLGRCRQGSRVAGVLR